MTKEIYEKAQSLFLDLEKVDKEIAVLQTQAQSDNKLVSFGSYANVSEPVFINQAQLLLFVFAQLKWKGVERDMILQEIEKL